MATENPLYGWYETMHRLNAKAQLKLMTRNAGNVKKNKKEKEKERKGKKKKSDHKNMCTLLHRSGMLITLPAERLENN